MLAIHQDIRQGPELWGATHLPCLEPRRERLVGNASERLLRMDTGQLQQGTLSPTTSYKGVRLPYRERAARWTRCVMVGGQGWSIVHPAGASLGERSHHERWCAPGGNAAARGPRLGSADTPPFLRHDHRVSCPQASKHGTSSLHSRRWWGYHACFTGPPDGGPSVPAVQCVRSLVSCSWCVA